MSGLISRMVYMAGRHRTEDDALTRVELARLEGTVAALVAEVQATRAAYAAGHLDHEDRIRRNERWRYSAPLTAVSALLVALVSLVHH